MQAGEKPATRPLKAKTINLALDRVRRILNLASRSWREKGKPWLHGLPPLIEILPLAESAYGSYKNWAIRNGHHALSSNAFGRRLKERFTKEKTRSAAFYLGLRLKTPQEFDVESAPPVAVVADSGAKSISSP